MEAATPTLRSRVKRKSRGEKESMLGKEIPRFVRNDERYGSSDVTLANPRPSVKDAARGGFRVVKSRSGSLL